MSMVPSPILIALIVSIHSVRHCLERTSVHIYGTQPNSIAYIVPIHTGRHCLVRTLVHVYGSQPTARRLHRPYPLWPPLPRKDTSPCLW